jgi:hypothetical protein
MLSAPGSKSNLVSSEYKLRYVTLRINLRCAHDTQFNGHMSKHHDMEAYRSHGGKTRSVLNVCKEWVWVHAPAAFTSDEEPSLPVRKEALCAPDTF